MVRYYVIPLEIGRTLKLSCFDDKHWCVYNLSLLGKLRKLLSGDFKIALDCKKSLKVGI